MRLTSLRALAFGCLALLATVFAYSSPGSARPPDFPTAAAFTHFDGDHVLVPAAAIQAEERKRIEDPDAFASLGHGPLPPVYALSMRTDGQSLEGPHMRC